LSKVRGSSLDEDDSLSLTSTNDSDIFLREELPLRRMEFQVLTEIFDEINGDQEPKYTLRDLRKLDRRLARVVYDEALKKFTLLISLLKGIDSGKELCDSFLLHRLPLE
jgi:hypothetical protein